MGEGKKESPMKIGLDREKKTTYHSYLSSPVMLKSGYSWKGRYLMVKLTSLAEGEARNFSSALIEEER